MNKQQLASKIWSGANKLRGKVSADAYKDYMLGLIFYKYISDNEEKYLKERLYIEKEDYEVINNDENIIENCKINLGYFINTDNLFSSWINKGIDFSIKDTRMALSSFERNVGNVYKKVYFKIFETLETGLNDLGTDEANRSSALIDLLNVINDIPMNGKQDYDVLGFVYEFLLKNFAANAGKAGEFYTPFEVSKLMSEIIAYYLKDRKQISIYDPTSGSGSLLLNIGKSMDKYLEDQNKIVYYAQELNPNTFNLTRMNLLMHDILPNNIFVRNNDTLKDDWPFFDDNDKENTYETVFVDACCSNPPYSSTWTQFQADVDPRYKGYGIAPTSKADYAFLLHNLYHLKPDGIMTIVMPHGVLFRGGEEGNIRKNLIEKGNIDTIIGLPANIFFGTGIPTIIIVLKKNRTNDDILFVDASKEFKKEGNKNILLAKNVRKIVDAVIGRKTIDKFSRLVTKEEIIQNEYNLNIPRYVDSSETETFDLYSTMFGGIPNKELIGLNKYFIAFPSLKKQLLKPINNDYSEIISKEFRTIIYDNKEVIELVKNYHNKLDDYKTYLNDNLINNLMNINTKKDEILLTNKYKELIQDINILDYYDCYQSINDNWNIISLDIETIQIEGYESIIKVDPNIVTKTKNKKSYEVQDGWIGHVIPFDLIQNEYFIKEKEEVKKLENQLSTLINDKEEYFKSIDSNDLQALLKKDSEEDIDSKKLNKEISKIKKDIKLGAIYEEGTYEDIIYKINNNNEEIKKIKKKLTSLKDNIIINTKNKIELLSKEESLQLLSKKWLNELVYDLKECLSEKINNLISELNRLSKKYEITLSQIDNEILSTEAELSNLIKELDSDKNDSIALDELLKLLGRK